MKKFHPNRPPFFNLEEYDNFRDALDDFLSFQQETREWIITKYRRIGSRRQEQIKALKNNVTIVYYHAQDSGMVDQLFTLASSIVLAMVTGSLHVYKWDLPCSIERVSSLDPNFGDINKIEWKIIKQLDFPSNSFNPFSNTQNIQRGVLNSVEFRFESSEIICDQLKGCNLLDSGAEIESEIYARLLSQFQDELLQFMQNSNFIRFPIQSSPSHLRSVFNQISFDYSNPMTGDELSKQPLPVIGMHIQLENKDSTLDRENSQSTSQKKMKKESFSVWNELKSSLIECTRHLIFEYLAFQNYKQVIIVLVTDENPRELQQDLQKEYNHFYGSNQVVVISTPGIPRHSSLMDSKKCDEATKHSYFKLLTDASFVCRSNVFFQSKGSTMSNFLVNYCDPEFTRMIHFNLWSLPQRCSLITGGNI